MVFKHVSGVVIKTYLGGAEPHIRGRLGKLLLYEVYPHGSSKGSIIPGICNVAPIVR